MLLLHNEVVRNNDEIFCKIWKQMQYILIILTNIARSLCVEHDRRFE